MKELKRPKRKDYPNGWQDYTRYVKALSLYTDQLESERDVLLGGNILKMNDSFRAYVKRIEKERDKLEKENADYQLRIAAGKFAMN